jgi:hypothetical protein
MSPPCDRRERHAPEPDAERRLRGSDRQTEASDAAALFVVVAAAHSLAAALLAAAFLASALSAALLATALLAAALASAALLAALAALLAAAALTSTAFSLAGRFALPFSLLILFSIRHDSLLCTLVHVSLAERDQCDGRRALEESESVLHASSGVPGESRRGHSPGAIGRGGTPDQLPFAPNCKTRAQTSKGMRLAPMRQSGGRNYTDS